MQQCMTKIERIRGFIIGVLS